MTPLLPESAAPAPRRRVLAAAAAVAALAVLSGCADMGRVNDPARPRTAAEAGLPAPGAAPAVTIDSQWWHAFGDPQLDRLIDQALRDNPSLRVAQARLEKAQAAAEVAGAARKPHLSAEVDVVRQHFSESSPYGYPFAGMTGTGGVGQLNAGWELDFFGKNRAALDAAVGAARAAAADAAAARVLLASNVARGYLQWARLNAQLAVAERTLAQRDETLRLVRDRVSAGLDTHLELRQSQGSLPEARGQIEALREQLTLQQHALDALVGQPNATQGLNPPALDGIKSIALQPVLPADLLGRRADIVAARWRVEAARQDVAGAKAQFYPNVNLMAFVGYEGAFPLTTWFSKDNMAWGVGPAVTLPIFEGGKLRGNLRGKTADLDAAIESYNAAVLDAVRDVADQITAIRSITAQQQQQREAQAAAEGAWQIAVQRYGAGLGNYLNVLTAETAVLAQRRQGVDLAARALDTQVALARALGGGWQDDTDTRQAAAPESAAATH
ncbi:MAG: efflux transporter outer membrane subunit [Xenophilus sp.]